MFAHFLPLFKSECIIQPITGVFECTFRHLPFYLIYAWWMCCVYVLDENTLSHPLLSIRFYVYFSCCAHVDFACNDSIYIYIVWCQAINMHGITIFVFICPFKNCVIYSNVWGHQCQMVKNPSGSMSDRVEGVINTRPWQMEMKLFFNTNRSEKKTHIQKRKNRPKKEKENRNP